MEECSPLPMYLRVKLYIYLLVVLGNLLVYQQTTAKALGDADSLHYALLHTTSDTSKVLILSELSYIYYISNTQKAIDYAQQGIKLAEKIKYLRGLAYCLNRKGVVYYFLSDQVEAMNIFLKSLAISDSIQDYRLSGMNLSKIADIHREAGNTERALEEHKKAIQLLRKVNDSLQLNIALNRIALIYQVQKKHEEAISNFKEALLIARKIKNYRQIAVALFYTGEFYINTNRFDSAAQYFREAYEINKIAKNRLLDIGILTYQSQILLKANKSDSAIILANTALRLAKKMSNKYGAKNATYQLYEIYKYSNNSDSSLKYYQLSTELKDSIFNENNSKTIRQLQTNYEAEKHKAEIQKNQREIQEQKTLIKVFVLSLIGIILLVFILYYANTQKVKANTLLNAQKQEISKQHHDLQILTDRTQSQYEILKKQRNELLSLNEEFSSQHEQLKSLNENLEETVRQRTKELEITIDNLHQQNQSLEQFSYIISHNLRAPVARILGLVNVIEKKDITGKINHDILAYLEKSTQNLDEILHDLTNIIELRNSFDKFREKITISEIVFHNLDQFKEEIEKNQVEIITNFLACNLIFSVKSSVNGILHNIISNAIKYRSQKRKLQITFKTQRIDDYICLFITDNGIGINLEDVPMYKIFGLYQRMHDHVEGKGLGLYLVKTQVETLNGKIEMESKEDLGTTLKVYFPDQTLQPAQ
ncbi:MAG: hypothetical protein EAZ08_00195 [Cytophagales bacterium]|nr:MAG: hypothetical protein EAZ08_00195 [Cytophagales bacterium]